MLVLHTTQNNNNMINRNNYKKPLVRFQLSTQLQSQMKEDLLKDFDDVDSGAPSPELSQSLQPANLKLLYTQQRISMLRNIEECLSTRAEHESARPSLTRLHEEIRTRLKNRIRQMRTEKTNQLSQVKKSYAALHDERDALLAQKSRLLHHIEQHERQHQNHQNNDSPGELNQGFAVKASDKTPSKKADQKLAAGRLLKEVIQLRARLATLERKIEQENRRKKQAEEELAILRAAMARHRKR